MAMKFDILEYMSGLTGYAFDKAVLQRIAFERAVSEVSEYEELDEKTRDLLLADLLYTAYLSPYVMASVTNSHGSYSQTVGSQTVSSAEKTRLYNSFMAIYRKYNDARIAEIESAEGSLQWL